MAPPDITLAATITSLGCLPPAPNYLNMAAYTSILRSGETNQRPLQEVWSRQYVFQKVSRRWRWRREIFHGPTTKLIDTCTRPKPRRTSLVVRKKYRGVVFVAASPLGFLLELSSFPPKNRNAAHVAALHPGHVLLLLRDFYSRNFFRVAAPSFSLSQLEVVNSKYGNWHTAVAAARPSHPILQRRWCRNYSLYRPRIHRYM